MRDVVVGWLGLVVFIAAVMASVAADVVRQRRTAAVDPAEPAAARAVGGPVFWLVVASVVLTAGAVVATVVRLTTLA